MTDVHAANTEVFTGDFDAAVEQEALQRLTRDDTVKVGVIIGRDLAYAVSGGKVGIIHGYRPNEDMSGCYLVQYRRGRFIGPDGQKGRPFDFGPYLMKFYHRDRIAEILRKHKEAA